MDTLAGAGRKKRRPNFSSEFKKMLAQQACEPGVSVSQLAQQHGINVNMLFKWRRNLVAGLFNVPTHTPVMLPKIGILVVCFTFSVNDRTASQAQYRYRLARPPYRR